MLYKAFQYCVNALSCLFDLFFTLLILVRSDLNWFWFFLLFFSIILPFVPLVPFQYQLIDIILLSSFDDDHDDDDDDDDDLMMNCFCGMVDRQNTFSLLSSLISSYSFRILLNTLAITNVSLWTYKSWHSPNFFISKFLPKLFSHV